MIHHQEIGHVHHEVSKLQNQSMSVVHNIRHCLHQNFVVQSIRYCLHQEVYCLQHLTMSTQKGVDYRIRHCLHQEVCGLQNQTLYKPRDLRSTQLISHCLHQEECYLQHQTLSTPSCVVYCSGHCLHERFAIYRISLHQEGCCLQHQTLSTPKVLWLQNQTMPTSRRYAGCLITTSLNQEALLLFIPEVKFAPWNRFSTMFCCIVTHHSDDDLN